MVGIEWIIIVIIRIIHSWAYPFIDWKSGTVDLDELIAAFRDLGIDVDETEATKLLQR